MTKSESMPTTEDQNVALFSIRASSLFRHSSFELRHSSSSQPAKLFERELPFDGGPRRDRCINQSRAGARKEDARNCAELADPHRGNGKIDVLPCDEVEKAREFDWRICTRRDLEDICSACFRSACFRHQDWRRRCRFEVVKRNDAPNFFMLCQCDQGKQCRCRAQFDIDIIGMR